MTATPRLDTSHPVAGRPFAAGMYNIVDLSAHFNNDGVAHTGNIPDGDLNGEGMAFPREVLPPSNQIAQLCDIPFLFPDKDSGADNNVCLEGKVVDLPPGIYRDLYVLGASEGGSFEEPLGLRYADGRTEEMVLGLTDCRPAWGQLRFGEQAAVRFDEMHFPVGDYHTCNAGDICGLWVQTLAVDAGRELVSIELGDNDSMHVFALSLRRAADWTPNDTWLTDQDMP